MANIIYPNDYVQARSPIYVQFAPEDAAEEIVIAYPEITVYTGDKTTGVSGGEVVAIEKPSPDGRVLLDLSQIIRAYFVQNYTSHNLPGSGVYHVAQALGAALWVKVTSSTMETDSSYTNGSATFLAMDGYTKWTDGVNKVHTETILTTPRTIRLLPTQLFNLPVKNTPRVKWAIGEDTDLTPYTAVPATGDDTNLMVVYIPCGRPNIQNIASLTHSLVAAEPTFEMYIKNNGNDATLGNIRIEFVCEPKFQGHYIAFINTGGVWDTMLFEKKSSEQMTVTADSHRRMIGTWGTRSGEDGTQAYGYNQREGLHGRINAMGQETITLNTGFLDEAYNEVMRQLLQSEYFLLDNTTPVQIETVDIEYKTGLNDKLIQYTITFKYAFEAINRAI
jgi:hypothetical protein